MVVKKKNEKITTVDKWWCWWRWSTTTATTSFRFNKFYIQQVSVCLFIWNIFIYKPLVVFFFWEQLKQKQTDEMMQQKKWLMINLWRKKKLSNNDRWCLCVCACVIWVKEMKKKKFQSKKNLNFSKKFFKIFSFNNENRIMEKTVIISLNLINLNFWKKQKNKQTDREIFCCCCSPPLTTTTTSNLTLDK